MESIDTELALKIRNDIILGVYSKGERLSELQLCKTYNVYRTPVRLALRLLEREGITCRGEGRGYVVQSPTVADILQGVEVRGHLEGLAARLMAQSTERFKFLPKMARAMETYTKLIGQGWIDEPMIRNMQAANRVFHTSIFNGCGNEYVGYTCDRICHLPMLAIGSMVFDRSVTEFPENMERGLFRLRLGSAQHQVIFEAIEKGDPVRAEGMMREHSHTLIEYIQTFEKQNESLTVADLVTYSAADINQK